MDESSDGAELAAADQAIGQERVAALLSTLREAREVWTPIDSAQLSVTSDWAHDRLCTCGLTEHRIDWEVQVTPRGQIAPQTALVTIEVTGNFDRSDEDFDRFTGWMANRVLWGSRWLNFPFVGDPTHVRLTEAGIRLQRVLRGDGKLTVINSISDLLGRGGGDPTYSIASPTTAIVPAVAEAVLTVDSPTDSDSSPKVGVGDWRAQLERIRESFLDLREPRLAAAMTVEPPSNVLEMHAVANNLLRERGYANYLESVPIRPPLDGETWHGAIGVHADGETVKETRLQGTLPWRTYQRFREDATRAVRAFNVSPITVRQAHGGSATPDAKGWLGLLLVAAWADGTALRHRCDNGETYREGETVAWFSCVTDLVTASVEFIDRLLTAEVTATPKPASDSEAGDHDLGRYKATIAHDRVLNLTETLINPLIPFAVDDAGIWTIDDTGHAMAEYRQRVEPVVTEAERAVKDLVQRFESRDKQGRIVAALNASLTAVMVRVLPNLEEHAKADTSRRAARYVLERDYEGKSERAPLGLSGTSIALSDHDRLISTLRDANAALGVWALGTAERSAAQHSAAPANTVSDKPPTRKGRKNISGRMHTELSKSKSDPVKLAELLDRTQRQWASALECSAGTVGGTQAWKDVLAMRATQQAARVDGS